VEDLAADPVELAQAPEARREGDLGHGEIGVVQKAPGEVCSGRARQSVRCHP
jgi:hypothetical protein